jgi:hypothetical protein
VSVGSGNVVEQCARDGLNDFSQFRAGRRRGMQHLHSQCHPDEDTCIASATQDDVRAFVGRRRARAEERGLFG